MLKLTKSLKIEIYVSFMLDNELKTGFEKILYLTHRLF